MTKFMKKLTGLALGLALITGVGVGVSITQKSNIKTNAETTDVSVTLKPSSFNLTTGYSSGAVRTATVSDIGFGAHYVMKNNNGTPTGSKAGDYMQSQANNATVYNNTIFPGFIKNIVLKQYASQPWAVYYSSATPCFSDSEKGTGQTPSGTEGASVSPSTSMTFDLSGKNAKYFCLKHGTGASYISEIIVTYQLKSTLSVTYDGNGATAGNVPTDENEYSENDEVIVKGNTESTPLIKTYYLFSGWNTKADGTGETYQANDKFEITTDITLYAKWIKKTLNTVSFTDDAATKTEYFDGEAYSAAGLKLLLTYSDSLSETIDISSADTVTLNPTYASMNDTSFSVSATVGGISTTQAKEVAVTVSENVMSLTWNDGFDGNFTFIKGAEITSTHIGTVKANWNAATQEHEKIKTLEYGTDYSLGLYKTKSSSGTPVITISSLPYSLTLEARGLYIGASYNGKITFKSTAFTIRDWRSVMIDTTTTGLFDFSEEEEKGTAFNITTLGNCYDSESKIAKPSISGIIAFYNGNGSGGDLTNTCGIARIGKSGSVTFTFDSTVKISSVTMGLRSWSSTESCTVSVTNSTSYNTTSGSFTDHTFTLSTTTNVITISTNSARAFIDRIEFTAGGKQDIGKTEQCLKIEEFIESTLHMKDYTEDKGWCKDTEHHYYATAKTAFNELSDEQRELFLENDAYTAEATRLRNWAKANGEIIDTESNSLISATNSKIIGGSNSDTTIAIIAVISLIGVSAIGGYFFIRKTKHE